jgi:hypothetical protein
LVYFRMYLEDWLLWGPVLAYAYMHGDNFVRAEELGNVAMPVRGPSLDWKLYPFAEILEAGLTGAPASAVPGSVVPRSEVRGPSEPAGPSVRVLLRRSVLRWNTCCRPSR